NTDERQAWSRTQSLPDPQAQRSTPTWETRTTRKRSQPSSWIAEALISPWAAARRNLFQPQKAVKDKIRAICCSSFVATDSISSAHARIWTRFQRGAGRNFLASSATTTSRSQIRWKNEASSPVFRTWDGEPL